MVNNKYQDLWLVVAAYNEDQVILDVLKNVLQHFPNVVVVDDGSTDNTISDICLTSAYCIPHPINLGQGAALKTGIDFALSKGAKYISTFDADGQHSIDDVKAMYTLISKEDTDVILGSRFLGKAVGITKFRRVFLKAAALFTGVTSGVWLTDAHNGLRMFNDKAAYLMDIRQNRMSHASEIISLIGINKLRYIEAPVTITYTEYSIAKGQKLSNSVSILIDQFMSKFIR
ncbi:glycosyltransferase family 2 protein [Vibrio kanaloae]|uniref:glycosyltransferase family 2 protein n=1 Tax=Vibrio kanaloae TaxID=170673 RepID=UPI000C85467E|nr:glycosyltransferase family 2 protein [Vibrio kanaloae]PMG27473.1 hypothetical protein BCU97_22645 [Vibrio splendidus]PTO65244.1 glycosyltransferase family 2 protein [Vibrio splendidus]TKE98679.1 glycosyltransferase family 2 protein [Vibrio kanaloae]TKF54163.1 glycosyltransferase family 2 protein [Vibrio kanaloae]